MKNSLKAFFVVLIFSSFIQAQNSQWWLPVTAFPDEHFFPSYVIATAQMWKNEIKDGIVGELRGILGITIQNKRDNAEYLLEISAPEIAYETKYSFTIPSASSKNWFNVYPNINYKYDMLRNFSQPTPANVSFTLYENGKNCGTQNITIIVHNIYDCPLGLIGRNSSYIDMSYMFSAYVNENDPVIEDLKREAINTSIISEFTGYLSGKEAEVWMQVTALWSVLFNRGITYSNRTTPSVGINQDHLFCQQVRFPSDALKTSQANCIDGTVLFASLLRNIGIHSVIVLIPGHAFVGFIPNDDNNLAPADYIFLETTALGVKVSENQIALDYINLYKDFLSNEIYLYNKEAILNFIYCYDLGQNEFDKAKLNIENMEPSYKLINVDLSRDKLGIISVSR
jgi:hypothetical protein